jgi:hypothetical protein
MVDGQIYMLNAQQIILNGELIAEGFYCYW